jgi:hypothetical protein
MASSEMGNVALLRVLFALQRVPPDLASAMLTDEKLIGRFEIPASPRRLKLSDTATVERDALLAAFRAAIVAGEAQVLIRDGRDTVTAVVRIVEEGTGVLEAGNVRTKFAHVGLWHEDAIRRSDLLAAILRKRTVESQSRRELQELVNSSQFRPETLVKVSELLSATPEEFVLRLHRLTQERSQFHEEDFLPEDPRHWDNLTAVPTRSKTFLQYINDELRAERVDRLSANAAVAFEMLSLQFVAQESVPHDWFELQSKDDVLRCMEAALNFEDHSSLAGAFEICARNFAADARLVLIGDRLLDKLFSDKPRLLQRCALFGAVFILSTVRLAMHARTRDRPIYWRRFNAATHASLVVRAFGETGPSEEIFDWAMKMRQDYYILSVYAEMGESPRWQPEWIEPTSLAADTYGRAVQILQRIPESELPASWADRLTEVGQWINEIEMTRRAYLPSLTQGERPVEQPTLSPDLQAHLEDAFLMVKTDPTPDNLMRLANMIELGGVLPEGSDALAESVKRVLADVGLNLEMSGPILAVSARVAVLGRDANLAELVADHIMQLARTSPDDVRIFNSLVRLVECAAADSDPARSRNLAGRVENFAGLLPAGDAALRLMVALRCLRRAHVSLAPVLGRAENIAKLATLPIAMQAVPDLD